MDKTINTKYVLHIAVCPRLEAKAELEGDTLPKKLPKKPRIARTRLPLRALSSVCPRFGVGAPGLRRWGVGTPWVTGAGALLWPHFGVYLFI